jgi:oligoribonuclease NrnB/cAMP/cGMP phosphodiesterase (DHH superfamily)
MTALPRPDIIYTHESDLDGFVAGLLLQRLAKKIFGANIKLEAYHYNYWKQRDLRDKAAWATDFSFEPRMDKENWLIIDHHPAEAKPTRADFIHDVTKSAGTLCYELCQQHGLGSPALDRLVHLNNVADLFLEHDPDFVLAGDYAGLVKHYQFWNLHALIGGELEQLVDHPLLEVMAAKRRVEDPLGLAWSKKNITQLSATVGCVDTVVGNTNLIVHQLLETNASQFPVLVTLFRRANNVVIASFRSRGGEALAVAQRVQGGGHPNACGAVMPKSVKTVDEAREYLKQVLNPRSGAPLNAMENLFGGFSGPK